MERLSDTVIEIVNELHRERLDYDSEYLPLMDAINRLAAYEDTGLEPQTISEILDSVSEWYDAHKEGRLLVLPCKVGTIVWVITTSYTYGEVGDPPEARRRIDRRIFTLPMFYSYGKTVFLTREEAEAKLKEREGK